MYMPEFTPATREHRTETRHKVFLLGTISHDGQAERTHVLDISLGGAKLHSAAPPPQGARVELALGDFHLRGEVRWAYRERFGIRFDHRLTLKALDVTIG
jgi:hypothetical protein